MLLSEERVFAESEEDFWSDPRGCAEAFGLAASDQGRFGLFIRAPAFVPAGGARVPVVGSQVLTLRQARGFRLRELAVVVASNLETHRVYVGRAFEPPQEIDDPQPESDEPPAEGSVSAGFEFDLDARVHLPPTEGTYLVGLFAREFASNLVRVRVGRDPHGFRDAAAEAFVQERLRRLGARAVWPPPGLPLPTYHPVRESPPVPPVPGLALRAERVGVYDERAPVLVTGSFRLRALPHERVREAPRAGDTGERASAVVSITLVVTASDTGTPLVYPLAVPSYDAARDDDETPTVTGHFALDLLSLPGLWREPRTLFVTAFAGELAAGPAPVALVSQAMVPSRWP